MYPCTFPRGPVKLIEDRSIKEYVEAWLWGGAIRAPDFQAFIRDCLGDAQETVNPENAQVIQRFWHVIPYPPPDGGPRTMSFGEVLIWDICNRVCRPDEGARDILDVFTGDLEKSVARYIVERFPGTAGRTWAQLCLAPVSNGYH